MPADALKTATLCVPDTLCNSTSFKGHIPEARLTEKELHAYATELFEKDTLDQSNAAAWSATMHLHTTVR